MVLWTSENDVYPYAKYDVEVVKAGFQREERRNIQIFTNTVSTLTILMTKENGRKKTNQIDFPSNTLDEMGSDQNA